jgi:hypothetical protein
MAFHLGKDRLMATLTLKAHFDGQQIRLDEPFDLPKDAELLVTIVPTDTTVDAERRSWYELCKQSLGRCYGDDEPEYSLADCKS